MIKTSWYKGLLIVRTGNSKALREYSISAPSGGRLELSFRTLAEAKRAIASWGVSRSQSREFKAERVDLLKKERQSRRIAA